MAKLIDYQSILDAALGPWAGKGYRLQEDGDHFLYLRHGMTRLATFNQLSVDIIPQLHEKCRNHFTVLMSIHSWCHLNNILHDDTEYCGHACRHEPGSSCSVPDDICAEFDCPVRGGICR